MKISAGSVTTVTDSAGLRWRPELRKLRIRRVLKKVAGDSSSGPISAGTVTTVTDSASLKGKLQPKALRVGRSSKLVGNRLGIRDGYVRAG